MIDCASVTIFECSTRSILRNTQGGGLGGCTHQPFQTGEHLYTLGFLRTAMIFNEESAKQNRARFDQLFFLTYRTPALREIDRSAAVTRVGALSLSRNWRVSFNPFLRKPSYRPQFRVGFTRRHQYDVIHLYQIQLLIFKFHLHLHGSIGALLRNWNSAPGST